MKFSKKEYIPLAILILIFLSSIITYSYIPKVAPIHWNAAGQADSYAGKQFVSFLLPVLSVLIYALLVVLPKLDPLKKNVAKFSNHYLLFRIVFLLFLGYVHMLVISSALGFKFNFAAYIIPAAAALIFFAGSLTYYSKRNYFIGIRTPWTLQSDKAWEKTNKLGGMILQIYAIVLLPTAFISQYIIWTVLVPLILIITFIFFYSYFVYKKI